LTELPKSTIKLAGAFGKATKVAKTFSFPIYFLRYPLPVNMRVSYGHPFHRLCDFSNSWQCFRFMKEQRFLQLEIPYALWGDTTYLKW